MGIMLILLSVAGLLFWEWKGRETILMEEVLVAKETIQKGTAVTRSKFLIKGVPKENMLEEALTPDEWDRLEGKVASQLIAKNDQIILEYFRDNEFYLDQGESIFVIEENWVAMRSSSLRRGDIVEIYGTNGYGLLGTFQIAYVKDASEREVKNAGEGMMNSSGNDILERTDSTSIIDHIEIISSLSEYEKLSACVNGVTPAALIIVQRGEKIDS